MWVLVHHDSSAAPQTVQTASPVCGTKNFVSVRLYSAPQLHRTIVAILGICAYGTPKQVETRRHNQTDPLPAFGCEAPWISRQWRISRHTMPSKVPKPRCDAHWDYRYPAQRTAPPGVNRRASPCPSEVTPPSNFPPKSSPCLALPHSSPLHPHLVCSAQHFPPP